jgi:DNA modification methylase
MKTVSFPDGVAIQGTFPDPDVLAAVVLATGPLPLVIADPPYGNIVNKAWDRIEEDDKTFCSWMIDWTRKIQEISLQGSALYVWGGVGRPRNGNEPPFRPFLRYLVEAELQTGYELSTPITWKKKRAYGIQWGYLFTREELAYFVLGKHKHPRKFTVPLLEAKRGYAGYEQDVVVGYFDGCYHTQHEIQNEAASSHVSSEAQAQSKRLVYELLRQETVSLGPGISQSSTPGLVRKEQGTSPSLCKEMGSKASPEQSIVEHPRRSQKARDSLRLDDKRSASHLDKKMSSVRDSVGRQQQETEQLAVDRQNRQLCWVCTWEHLHHVVASQPAENGCDNRGAGSPCGVHEKTSIEDVSLAEKQMKYPAKSEFFRRTNVWDDITEIMRGKTHINQKPRRLMEIPIEVHTEPGEWVLDPFAGSGTTAHAARALGRRFVVVEKDPEEFEKMVASLRGEEIPLLGQEPV